MIRLLVLDMDGTLYNSRTQISPRNKAALRAAQEKGVRVALASGRNYQGLQETCRELELDTHDGFVVGNNGQDLYDFRRGELTQGAKICRSAWITALEVGKRRNMEVFGHNNGEGCYYAPREGMKLHPGRESRRYDETTGLFDEPGDMDKIGIFIPQKEPYCYEVLDELCQLIRTDEAQCVLVNPLCIELVPPGMDKSVGVDQIVERYGLARDEVLVMGDGQNDLGMAKKYPFVAMANALSEVKACALRITASNDDDGVALEIERSILHP